MVVAEVQTDSTFQVVDLETLFTTPRGFVWNVNSDFYDITADDQRFLMVRRYVAAGDENPSAMILWQNFFEVLKERVPN